MGVNKVEYYGRTLMDTTGTTVSEDTLMEGETAINAAGEVITGNLRPVKYTAQNPTAAEQEQARKNIDALGTGDLPEAINDALAQAKASGEFDGKDGVDGVGIKTIEQVVKSTIDGADNVWRLTLTNGQTFDLTIQNGAKGSKGDNGKSAYEQAVEGGYTGSETAFERILANCVTEDHTHEWNDITDRPFGRVPTEEGVDTITSDDVIYGGYHKVSEFIPTMDDLLDGGSLTYYSVSDGKITGELKTINFPQGDYTIKETNNGIMINSDGVPMVLISFNGDPEFGAITFPDITEPGVYFDQGDFNKCIHSLTINNYDGFKFYEIKTIPEEYLPSDIGAVKTVNYISPDANGNINIEVGEGGGGGGSSKAGSAFSLLKSDTLVWNGDTEGRVVATNTIDPSSSYVHVSSVIPTLAELQKGGSYATTGADGIPYEQPFTSESIVDSDTLINCFDGYVLIAKEDGAHFVDEYTDCTLPKAGIYYAYFGAEGYTSKLAITDYAGFVKPILKMENLTPHGHDWYGKAVDKGNTVRGDETIYNGYVKVSDSVPTEAEMRKGGVVRFYDVEDGQIGDLITGDFLSSDFQFFVNSDEITIWYGFSCLVVISRTGKSNGNGIDSPGVYFYQGEEYFCMHSLTINGYEDFEYNVEKIPTELIPEGIGGGASSWKDLTDKPFGEETVMGDTLTWDGNTEGLYCVSGMLYHVSDAVPTLEDLENFVATMSNNSTNESQTIDGAVVTPMGENGIFIMLNGNPCIVIALADNADIEGIMVEKAGVYFAHMGGGYISSFTINNYTGFETTEIKTIDAKYLPVDYIKQLIAEVTG